MLHYFFYSKIEYSMKKITAVSLFSGAGGMDVGFERAGFEVVAANEMDSFACKTFRENHPGTTLLEGDINDHISGLAKYKNIDVVFGGPPCQGFSVAGKMDLNDPRSKLVFSFVDVVEKLKPKMFVMENVKSLATLDKFKNIREGLFRRFYNLGYSVSMNVLNAKDYGSAQNRERVFFIGSLHKISELVPSVLQSYKQKALSVRAVIQHLGPAGSDANAKVCNAKITLASNPILRKSPYAGMLFNGQGRPLNPDGWSGTLPASMGGNRTPIIDERHLYEYKDSWVESYHGKLMNGEPSTPELDVPKYLRRLTVDEASLLQGFPAGYKFIGPQSKVYSQIGNAVPCTLAEAVASTVSDLILKYEFVSDSRVNNAGVGETFEMYI